MAHNKKKGTYANMETDNVFCIISGYALNFCFTLVLWSTTLFQTNGTKNLIYWWKCYFSETKEKFLFWGPRLLYHTHSNNLPRSFLLLVGEWNIFVNACTEAKQIEMILQRSS